MGSQIALGDLVIDVEHKDIKNVHLSVYPPAGHVRISAPARMSLDTIRLFALSKLDWIKQQQRELRAQARETPREYLERESHYLWGQRLLLQIEEIEAAPRVELRHRTLLLHVRPGASPEKRAAVLAAWYRGHVRDKVEPLIETWQERLGVTMQRLYVRQMKTRWGSCNPVSGSIRLNTELAKKPVDCLEYILVHELLHLLEPTHNARFTALLDQHLPQWEQYRNTLNRLPVRHEE